MSEQHSVAMVPSSKVETNKVIVRIRYRVSPLTVLVS